MNKPERGPIRRELKAIAIGIVILLAIGASHISADQNWIDHDKLHARQILVKTDRRGESDRRRVRAAVLIDARPEQVWKVMLDCSQASDIVPRLKRCTVLERLDGGRKEIIEHQVKYSWLLPKATYVFDADYEPYQRIGFRRIRGSIKRLEGSWLLEPVTGDKTLLMYSVHINPGFFTPKWLVRSALKKDLPAALKALRARVESNTAGP